MAKYSFSSYGLPKYGEIENTRVYNNVNLRAWSYDYQTVSLVWGSVTSDPADYIIAQITSIVLDDNVVTVTTASAHNFIENLPVNISGTLEATNGNYTISSIPSPTTFTYTKSNVDIPLTTIDPVGAATVGRPTHWKLIKSYAGAPNNPYDGILVDGDLITNYRLSKIDFQNIDEGSEVTYSFWIFNGIRWINCGSARTVLVSQTDTLNKISKWIPRAWLNAPGDATGEPEDSDLYNTLSAYAFEYDKFRTEAELLYKSSNYQYLPAAILKNKITDLGFSYEPALGDLYHRALYGSGNIINSLKGTSSGVKSYTTALTHWTNEIVTGHNLMLDYNDSSFEESLGRWTTSAGNFTRHTFAASLAEIGVAVTAPTPGLYDLLFPPRTTAFARVHGHNSAVTLTLNGSNPILYGIPVTPGKRYLFTGWVRTKAADKIGTVQARINWHDKSGTLLSSESYNSALTAGTTWQEFNSGSVAGRNGRVAPENAAYVVLNILITPINNQAEFFLDMLKFGEAQYSLEYQDARLVQVVISGESENLIPNPTFEGGLGGWYSLNSTMSQDFNAPATSVIYGDCVAKLIATTDQDRVALVSDWIPVDPGKSYTFSTYVSGSAHNAVARIEYSVPQSADEQTTILSDEDGQYYPQAPYIVDSAPAEIDSIAQRISVSSIAPVFSQDSGRPLAKVSVYIDTADIGDTFYFDAALFQQNSAVDAFFCGDGAPTPASPITETFFDIEDCRWETKNVLNYVSNPSLETTTDWTAGSGSTLTSVSEVPALFGTKQGKVSKAGGGQASITVYLPYAALGGEDVVVSAYVRNKAGTYSISTTGQAVGNFIVTEANKDEWTRIHTNRVLPAGETSFALSLSLSTGNGAAAVFYFDGVQAEFGRIPSKFTDPASPETITRPNLLNPAVNMYAMKYESRNGGKSLYWTTYGDKYARLYTTLSRIMPNGSTWAIVPGKSTTSFPELDDSLIPSASFENDLGSWAGVSANLTRSIPRGTLFDETCTHGTAFCRVSATASSTFGITSGEIAVKSQRGYYASAAIRPENVDAFGNYTITLNFYDEFDVLILTKTSTIEVRRNDRWAYIAAFATSSETIGASYAKVRITADVDTPEPGHTFHVDRVVFRE
jgi:hypothetical protein